MSIVESELALLRHPRLAALATSAWPAWLWSADGSRIRWTNAIGAAIFGAGTATALSQRRFDARDAAAAQIVRLAATLPSGGRERLERLRGFGSGFGRALTCFCSRIVLADGTGAVLVAAAEAAGPALTLEERVRRLFDDDDAAVAAFKPDGTLLYASAAAQRKLGGAMTLSALGIEPLARTAFETGSAGGTTCLGDDVFTVAAARLGNDATRVLALVLTPQPKQAAAAEAAPQDRKEPAVAAQAEVAPATPAAPTDEPQLEPPPAPPAPPAAMLPSPPGAAPPSPPEAVPAEPILERRHPLRFVWHMDADGRFGIGSDEFIELVGPRTMAAFGRLWSEISAELKLDPAGQVARAVATRETWSGIVISWPVDDSSERLPVELSGLPVFDRDRGYRGYRGFGVCRDIDRINQLARARRERPIGFMPAPETASPPATAVPPPAAAPEKTGDGEAAVVAPPPERLGVGPTTPAAANVVPFRPSSVPAPPAPPPEPKVAPTLSPVERRAFRELAQELTSRLRGPQEAAAGNGASSLAAETAPAAEPTPVADTRIETILLDRIPVGILVYRHDSLLYANRHFLEWSGYENLAAIEAAGGLNTLFAEPAADVLAESSNAQALSITTRNGDKLPVEGRMITVPWNGVSAMALILTNGQAAAARRAAAQALDAVENENRELKSVLDAATDGVICLDAEGHILTVNARAAALFGRAATDLVGQSFGNILTAESEAAARDYLARVARGTSLLDNLLDVEARTGQDHLVPLAMTLTRLGSDRFYAVFRDTSARKEAEDDLRNARREAVRAAASKAEFLAKISHEIRTPLNAMTGFAEVIMAERFGPIGNERYREYLKDIHGAGTHLVAMLNDLLDLSKIESGQIDLTFTNVGLNDLTQQCVGIMQPQASGARIIIRTSLTPGLPPVIADERSLRQIVLNLLANSIRFTGPGGQVIVSTVFSDVREVVLRVRDTGVGMSEKDIQAALEPFQQSATSGSWGSGGIGFGLPLTKALAEANRANFSIKSAPNAGTLVEIAFPPNRVVAD